MTDESTPAAAAIHSVDDQAFLDDFRLMSTFGATAGGGVDRQAATPAHADTRAWLSTWMTDRGFDVATDPIGNLFGLVTLTPGAPYVLVGSHLDSQPLGGRFDGAYGVLAAAHAVDRLRRAGGASAYNLAVVDWFNEEGCRFKPSMMGSAVFMGKLPLEKALATLDPAGVSVAEALAAIDAAGTAAPLDVHSYAELHIEQGRVLEETSTTIGVVEGTWCAYKYEVVVTGEQSHTGSTRMADRRDALLGASRVVVAVNELTASFDDGVLHSSVGEFHVEPNSPVVVAREVRMLMDLRARTSDILNQAFALLETDVARIAALTNVEISVERSSVWESSQFLDTGVTLVREIADSLGLPHTGTLTLAGHDATNMKEVVPTVLVFVPSVEGISHNERELTADPDLLSGVAVLTELVARLAAGAL